MENENLTNKLLSIAERMNLREYSEELNIPIINGYNIIDSKVPETILIAKSKDGFIEQFISDGILNEKENFETRIDKTINDIKKIMIENKFDNPEKNIMFFKDFNNNCFTYKIFVQNNIIEKNEKKLVTRQFIAFFIEPKNNIFYQVSLCSNIENLSSTTINLNRIDINNDIITKYLNDTMETILINLNYK